LPSREMSLTG